MAALFTAELGDDELCRASAEEVFRFGELINSPFVIAQGHWKLAVLASYQGDAEATIGTTCGRPSSETPGGGISYRGSSFPKPPTCSTGPASRPWPSSTSPGPKAPKDAGHLVALAEAALEARHGDPKLAERKLVDLAQHRLDQREQWRVTLLRGFAAFRLGEHHQAGALGGAGVRTSGAPRPEASSSDPRTRHY